MNTDAAMLCVDGSDASERAVAAGLGVLQAAPRALVVTVIEPSDPTLVTGTGFAGGVISPEELHELERNREAIGRKIVEHASGRLGLDDAEVRVLTGTPGPALCSLAGELPARVLVMGTRGRAASSARCSGRCPTTSCATPPARCS